MTPDRFDTICQHLSTITEKAELNGFQKGLTDQGELTLEVLTELKKKRTKEGWL